MATGESTACRSGSIRAIDSEPLKSHRIHPIPADLVETVSGIILTKNARKPTGAFHSIGLHINSNYDEEYDLYEKEIRERDIPALHTGVARQFSAYPIEVILENAGALAAEHVTVELRSGNSRLHADPFLVDMFGPPPPSTRSNLLDVRATAPVNQKQLAGEHAEPIPPTVTAGPDQLCG